MKSSTSQPAVGHVQRERLAADVVVVGGGGAGLAAAVRAAELGGRVILLEKNSKLGGSTGRSLGAFSASNSYLQRKARISDSPDLHFSDMSRLAGPNEGRDNTQLRHLLVENSGVTLDWLLSYGVRFHGPIPDAGLSSVPRMCVVLPNSSAYIYHFEKAARHWNVQILTDFRVNQLTLDGNTVTGVEGRHADGTESFLTAPNVILASGDFSASEELKRRYAHEAISKVAAVNPTSTGDGISMGVSIGGCVLNGDLEGDPVLRLAVPKRSLLTSLPPIVPATAALRAILRILPAPVMDRLSSARATVFVPLSSALFDEGAVLVNRRGERFMSERSGHWEAIVEQPGGEAFVIIGGQMARQFDHPPNYVASGGPIASTLLKDYRRSRRDIYHASRTVDDLAANIHVPVEALRKTLADHNATQSNSVLEPPFIALGPAGARLTTCNAGLAVDDNLKVLRDGHPVEGLYAVGSNGQGGLLLQGLGHHVAWAFISGRLAAEHAMREVTVTAPPSTMAP